MNDYKSPLYHNESLVKKIKALREISFKKKPLIPKERLYLPVSSWIKEDRLLNEKGKEFTIILRTKGCSWALGKSGGCSMCGYIQDAYSQDIEPELILKQFEWALNKNKNNINGDKENFIIKIFNSGSFFDENEISASIRSQIYEKIANLTKIKEVVVESRIEYVTQEKLAEMKDYLKDKYCEIGIGLETTNDYIRNNYINKGVSFEEFQTAVKLCNENSIGVKAYILFKPPFLNEQSAIDDCKNSIITLIKNNISSISINPVNIQKGSLTEYLWYQNRYRPPWFYSLFKCLKKALTQDTLKKTRILCDPSGAGTKRGIHNCLKRECNENMKKILQRFVLEQDINKLKEIDTQCECKNIYQLQKDFW